MGIPYYFYTLYKKYNRECNLLLSAHQVANLSFGYLFFDYNSLIHPCAQRVIARYSERTCERTGEHTSEPTSDHSDERTEDVEDLIILETLNYTRYIISLLKPTEVHIVIDGVAPRAKINQQRERRYKSQFLKQTKSVWDSNNITPGTAFMDKLIGKLQIFKNEIEGLNLDGLSTRIYISDSDVSGEGEHKMINWLNTNYTTLGNSKICIYGLDADLIMLSLLSRCHDNIILLRDNSFNEKLKSDDRTFTYLDISILRSAIYQDSGLHEPIDRVILDYCALCFLLGNDFLEHIPSLNLREGGLSALTRLYTGLRGNESRHVGNYLVNIDNHNKTSINFDMLRDIFDGLCKNEVFFFTKIMKNNEYRDNIDINTITNTGKVDIITHDFIKYNKIGYKERYYNYYGVYDIDACCRDYLTGLQWVLGYYTDHIYQHNNWTWYYKYHAVPFASDISNYLSKQSRPYDFYPEIDTCANSTLTQLYMVLPRESLLNTLSIKYPDLYIQTKNILESASVDVQKHYPKKIVLDMINKEYLWQSKVFLEHFDKRILEFLIN